ncbi:MAG: UDP-3-O-(3-hydroxymyristoyl)glucosamine N-acyltransferase [Alphaproteobacteria bacterium]
MIDTNFYINKGPFNLNQIADICGASILRGVATIKDINTMNEAGEGEICFFYDKKAKEKASNIKASACVTTEDLSQFVPEDVAVLISANPKKAFLDLNLAFYEEKKPLNSIAQSAKISASAKIGQDCFVGENVVIEDNVVIGDNCFINHNAIIAQGCKIGNNTKIDDAASIRFANIGNNCYIYSGAKIGHDGFGFLFDQGQHKRIPQVGKIIIGNDVEVGANACIDRGALGDTIIADGCRVDNLVQIAHNDKLGRGCVIVSQTGIAGSTTLGDYVVCGGQVGIADHVNIGSGVQIAAQSGLIKDVAPGDVVMGYPAVPIKDFMRQTATIQKMIKKK